MNRLPRHPTRPPFAPRYDAENRLIQAIGYNTNTHTQTTYEFGYDGLGRRVSMSKDGVKSWFLYDGDQLIAEREALTDDLVVEYVWGPTAQTGPAIIYQNRIVTGSPQERWFYTSPQGGFPRYAFATGGGITDTIQYSSMGELVYGGGTQVEFGARGAWQFAATSAVPFVHLPQGPMGIPSLGFAAKDQDTEITLLASAIGSTSGTGELEREEYCTTLAGMILDMLLGLDIDPTGGAPHKLKCLTRDEDFGRWACCMIMTGCKGVDQGGDCLQTGYNCVGWKRHDSAGEPFRSCTALMMEMSCYCGTHALTAGYMARKCGTAKSLLCWYKACGAYGLIRDCQNWQIQHVNP